MSKHKCSRDLYSTFLQVTSQRYSAFSLSEVSPDNLSHDAVSRWLAETSCRPQDIWKASKPSITAHSDGILVADETVIDKSRSDKIKLVRWQYSGAKHDIVKGIGLLNFLWVTDDEIYPEDFRIWEPVEDGRTKNDHFRDQIKAAKRRGLHPEAVVADSWYSSLDNVKCIRDQGWDWVMGLRKNRVINRGERLEDLNIPGEGLRVHLRGYGWIKVFRFVSRNGRTDYIGTSILDATTRQVKTFLGKRWQIEVFHRELKQTCGLECCQSRTSRAQRNHIALSILSWIKQARIRKQNNLSFYQQQWDVIKSAIAEQLRFQLSVT